jgi:hypothetical protein
VRCSWLDCYRQTNRRGSPESSLGSGRSLAARSGAATIGPAPVSNALRYLATTPMMCPVSAHRRHADELVGEVRGQLVREAVDGRVERGSASTVYYKIDT